MLNRVEELHNNVLEAEDGVIGRCKDFLFDDQLWTIRYMVADTGKWLPGRKVLVAPNWIQKVDWAAEKAVVDLTRDAVKNSPEYDASAPPERDYETRLFDFYGLPKYWEYLGPDPPDSALGERKLSDRKS
jgi:hypothetical protein